MHKPKVGEWIRYIGTNDNGCYIVPNCIGEVIFIYRESQTHVAMGVDWKIPDTYGANWSSVPYNYSFDTLELISQKPALTEKPPAVKPHYSSNIMDFADQVAEIIERKSRR